MRPACMQFRIGHLMAAVALVACSTGAVLASSAEPDTACNVLTGWGALHGVPALLILARGIPLGRAARIVGRIVAFGLPVAGLYGLLCFTMSGDIGLFGGLCWQP